jgi:hypothetical protein
MRFGFSTHKAKNSIITAGERLLDAISVATEAAAVPSAASAGVAAGVADVSPGVEMVAASNLSAIDITAACECDCV